MCTSVKGHPKWSHTIKHPYLAQTLSFYAQTPTQHQTQKIYYWLQAWYSTSYFVQLKLIQLNNKTTVLCGPIEEATTRLT